MRALAFAATNSPVGCPYDAYLGIAWSGAWLADARATDPADCLSMCDALDNCTGFQHFIAMDFCRFFDADRPSILGGLTPMVGYAVYLRANHACVDTGTSMDSLLS